MKRPGLKIAALGLVSVLTGGLAWHFVDRIEQPASVAPIETPARPTARADFGGEQPSSDVRRIADWVVDVRDNGTQPFAVIDKINAKLYVFAADGHLRGAAPVLLGLARGDDTVPGIGDRPLADIKPEERTTPAGRFRAEMGRNARGEDVVWVDYDAAVSMHRVLTANRSEHRLERLGTPTVDDNRISYGCINVPTRFYEEVLKPAFLPADGIVYVLPETRPLQTVFHSYELYAQDKTAARKTAGAL